MITDELINIWKTGDDLMFRDEKTDKAMITQYLNDQTLKGSRSIKSNILFYWFIQVGNLILISLNIAGYLNNPSMVWILVPQLVLSIGILMYGMDVFYKLREINNYSESLLNLITKQQRFFKKPYELWMVLSSISAVILMTNVNFYVDNINGYYTINNKLMFTGVTLLALLLIYGTQKVISMRRLKSLKAYLADLQQGVLDQTGQLALQKKRHVWLWVAVFILLSTFLVIGILTALK